MYINELENCCSVGLLSDFFDYGNTTNAEEKKHLILKEMKGFLYSYIEDGNDVPYTFFATTNTIAQKPWEDALQAIGFKARKFRSRHDKPREKSLNFWTLYNIPKELKPWAKEQLKQQKEYYL